MNRKNTGAGKPALKARIGIETGPVVVDAAGEIYGDAPNTAARVQSEPQSRASRTLPWSRQRRARLMEARSSDYLAANERLKVRALRFSSIYSWQLEPDCGIDPVADALAKSGCRTFFVTNLAEARRVRAAAPNSIIYVLHGLHAGAAPLFAKLIAQPVINGAIELAEWDAFVSANGWSGGCALNVDTGENRLGLSMAEAVQLSARVRFLNHGITLLMSSLASAENAGDPQSERQVAWFDELRRLYRGIPASLAGASAILLNRKSHFDLVRANSALFGINPTPGSANPMLPVVELQARIVHVRDMTPGQSFIDAEPKRRRLAMVSVGQADGFPRSWHPKSTLHAIVGGHRCPVTAPSSLDLLAIDVTDLPDAEPHGAVKWRH